MAITKEYMAQVELLLKVLPVVNKFDCFALKGGTALNLFIWDMPRISVDIDLVYLLINDRNDAFENINKALKEICLIISDQNDTRAVLRFNSQNMGKIFVNNKHAQIKIEPSYNLRGVLYGTTEYSLTSTVIDRFGDDYSVKIVSLADLYAGKICAALDRKHPRDLFDIRLILEEQPKINSELLDALVIYLMCSKRPIHELLNCNPNFADFDITFNQRFAGMTDIEVSPEVLKQAGLRLLRIIHQSLTVKQKQFLVAMAEGKPEWQLINIDNLESFPGICWKLRNIEVLKRDNPDKHKQAVDLLKKALSMK